MDFSNLVDEITRRVLSRVQSAGESLGVAKPKLLVLTAARNARFDHFRNDESIDPHILIFRFDCDEIHFKNL